GHPDALGMAARRTNRDGGAGVRADHPGGRAKADRSTVTIGAAAGSGAASEQSPWGVPIPAGSLAASARLTPSEGAAVGPGRNPQGVVEVLPQRRSGSEAELGGHLVDRQIAVLQQGARPFHAPLLQPLSR